MEGGRDEKFSNGKQDADAEAKTHTQAHFLPGLIAQVAVDTAQDQPAQSKDVKGVFAGNRRRRWSGLVVRRHGLCISAVAPVGHRCFHLCGDANGCWDEYHAPKLKTTGETC